MGRAIPIPLTTIGMRLPPNKTDRKRVASSKPKALGMVTNDRSRLNTYRGVKPDEGRNRNRFIQGDAEGG